jgi:hypothetical protein
MIADVVNFAIAGIGFCHAAGRLIFYKGIAASMNTVMTKIGLDGGMKIEGGIFPLRPKSSEFLTRGTLQSGKIDVNEQSVYVDSRATPAPRNTLVDSTRSSAMPHGTPAKTLRRNVLELTTSRPLTCKIVGENRSRPRPDETRVREMDAYAPAHAQGGTQLPVGVSDIAFGDPNCGL